jgi:L-lactate dehydrogenase complex protein LldF
MSLSPPNVTFHERVESALHDSNLQIALARTTERFTAQRANAFAALPRAEALRDRARLIRAHTLSRLDQYLAQFAESVERAGGHVHWADDAAAANRIAVEIAKSRGVKLVVKGKSMVTEETHLNKALAEVGATVLESDLGEYIIQLAGETPSHIIGPALHKTKEQIGQLLHEKIGMPLTDEPEKMMQAARAILREVFLTADMGITGVNFGVAETGAICLVENEGNGRLSTTPPRIHVAFMGLERLVPTLDDLSVMLQLLARSATGQKLSVYTNLITGPRKEGEADGPEELHIVIVDNGRSRVLSGHTAEILYCIRCGACLNACPVFQQVGGHAYGSVYSGPVGAVFTPSLWGIEPWSDLPHASSLCGACREVCPVRIDIPRMLLELRDEGHRAGKTPLWLRIGLPAYRFIATRPALFKIAVTLSRTASRLFASRGWLSRLPPPLNGWTAHRDFPAFASQSFSEQWREKHVNRKISKRGNK